MRKITVEEMELYPANFPDLTAEYLERNYKVFVVPKPPSRNSEWLAFEPSFREGGYFPCLARPAWTTTSFHCYDQPGGGNTGRFFKHYAVATLDPFQLPLF